MVYRVSVTSERSHSLWDSKGLISQRRWGQVKHGGEKNKQEKHQKSWKEDFFFFGRSTTWIASMFVMCARSFIWHVVFVTLRDPICIYSLSPPCLWGRSCTGKLTSAGTRFHTPRKQEQTIHNIATAGRGKKN